MPLSADGRLKLQALDDDVLEHKPGLSVDDDEAAILELATKILAIVRSIDSTTKDTMARTLWMNTKQTKFLMYCYNHSFTCWIDFICCCTMAPRLSMGPPVTDGKAAEPFKETLEDLELTVEGLERVGGDSAGGHVAAIAELTKALTIVENISSVTNAMMVRTTAMSTNQTAFLTYIYNHPCTCCIDFCCYCTKLPHESLPHQATP